MEIVSFSRTIDQEGKIELPLSLRQELDLLEGNAVSMSLEGRSIVLRKAFPCCAVCGGNAELRAVRGRVICQSCINSIKGYKE